MRSKKVKTNALLETLRSIITRFQTAKVPLVRLSQKENEDLKTHKKSVKKNKKTSKYVREFYAKKKQRNSAVNKTTSNVAAPDTAIPKTTAPGIHTPKMSVSGIKPPKMSVPQIKLPKIKIPKVTLAQITFPKITVPRIFIPKLKTPKVSVPKFSLSQLKNAAVAITSKAGLKPVGNLRAGIIAAAALVLILLAGGLVMANTEKNAFAVMINGKQAALVENRQEAERVLAALKAEKAKIWNRSVEIKESVAYRETKARRFEIDSIPDMTRILDERITFVAAATGIKINGKVSMVVKDARTAESILNRLKEAYVKSDMSTLSVKFEEKVEIVQVPADLKEITEPDKALEAIKNGRQKKVTHVVAEGDSLWMIARKNDMRVAELKAANPGLKGEKLDLGQELNLVKLEPMLNVLVEGQVTLNESLPYDVVVEKDSGMWRGRQKIKQKGENGSRQVTYKVVLKNGAEAGKTVLTEKVLKESKDQIVIKGARMVVASRRGSGRIGWPLGGGINSGYGRRWGRMHTGLDIEGRTGQPIGAASDGRVTFTGWDGAYGKTVVISHGGGLVTKYAHLSKIEVEEGQQVSRGDLIGLVGSTGRSTGSHLHFEVIANGAFQNPMRYLR